jgi:serine/threonine protein kinase
VPAEASALLPLAESIADGSQIDWDAVEAGANGEDLAVIRQLRVLYDLALLHRSLPAPESRTPRAPSERGPGPASVIGSWAHLLLVERLGGGTFGDVYRAWDRHLECEVALKLLRAPEESDDLQSSRIAREGRLLARVRHPNVIAVHGVAVHDGRVGLWMELVRGDTLEQLLLRRGPCSDREAAIFGIDLCRAVAAIHGAGLIHRDIKAQNVMREEGGRTVLMDLGTGREIAGGPRHPLADLAGTPLYLAPEVFQGAPASERTDIYSLAVLLYHLVTGSFPVRGMTMEALQEAHATGNVVRLRDARADLPTEFVSVVDRAIANDPARRYASAGALESDLVRAIDERAVADDGPTGGHTSRKWLPPFEPVTPHPPIQPPRPREGTVPIDSPESIERQRSSAESRRGSALRSALWDVVRWAGVAVLFLIILGWLGFLSTAAFNTALGRSAPFDDQPWLDYIKWGVFSLIAPGFYFAATIVIIMTVVSMGKVLIRAVSLSPALRRVIAGVRVKLHSLESVLNDPVPVAQLLATVGTLGMAAIFWRFHGLIAASATHLNTAGSVDVFSPLYPGNAREKSFYGIALDVLSVGLGIGLVHIGRLRKRTGARQGGGALASVVALLCLCVLLLELPYRIMWPRWNQFERVEYKQARCYELGKHGEDVLISCPDQAPPRNRIIRGNDPAIRRTGVIESIFTPRTP